MNKDYAGRPALCAGDVLITDQLERRPRREPDYAAENRALTTLAQEMAQHTEGVLQKIAEIGMELSRRDSAGISVLEPGGEQGIFRCHAASGAFAPNLYGTIPRDGSPCRTVMDSINCSCSMVPNGSSRPMEGFEPRTYESLLTPWSLNGPALLDTAAIPNVNTDSSGGYMTNNLNMHRILGRRPLVGKLRRK